MKRSFVFANFYRENIDNFKLNITSMNLAKAYTPNDYEPNIYAMWETSGVFNPRGEGQSYTVVLPPPNANGNLHIGHALGVTIEDLLARYHRMRGRDSIIIPGADHAGFETWVVYEKILESEGKSRFDFSREQLYSQVWNFVQQQRGNMELQLRALGLGASWNNIVFTLDKKVIDTVYDTFNKLWQDNLIYRGEKIVNYCTKHQTSFADIEVVHKQEKSKLWEIAYPTFDKVGEIIVATTRPETMFGDTAVAVNPNDERYKHLIGTRVVVPLSYREIPIIADEYVDMNYGTGAVKITPAHDPNDFEVGERHGLERIQVIDFNGKLINSPEEFNGLPAEKAREGVLKSLKKEDFLRGEKTIEHAVGHCYKCGTIIQPLVKDQWFLRVKQLAENAKQAIARGDVTFTPSNKGEVLSAYLDNLRDWNLSRQIPWGIPIPAFQNENNLEDWIFDDRVHEKTIVVNGTTYRREEDTFDTWFSSGQWPFITTDYLANGQLANHYPLDVMETGGDILFPWVSRMLMLGLYRTGKVPFKHVYLHGLVLDEKGQKMSKSKGNVVNPMEAISEYGSDALRLGLISSRSADQPQAYSSGKVVAARNFCNKLWNIARYIQSGLGDSYKYTDPEPNSAADHWVIERLNIAADTLENQIENYRFAEAAETLYHAVWDDVADWYIEASKVAPNPSMLAWVLDTCLRLAHPITPFVTETIWQSISWHDDLLAGNHWPLRIDYDESLAREFESLKGLVSEARYVMSELPGNSRYPLLYIDDTLVAKYEDTIKHLARVSEVKKVDQKHGLQLAASGRSAWLDIDAETLYEHQTNLEVRLRETHDQVKRLEDRLANESYVSQAPAHLVEETRQSLEDSKILVEKLQVEINIVSHR